MYTKQKHIYKHIHLPIYTCCVHTHMYSYIHTRTYIRTTRYTHVHMCIHVCTHINIHTYVTYTQDAEEKIYWSHKIKCLYCNSANKHVDVTIELGVIKPEDGGEE